MVYPVCVFRTGGGAIIDATDEMSEATTPRPPIDCTVTLSDETVGKWFNKEVDPMMALMEGMLSVSGDQMKMMSLLVLEPMIHSCWTASAPVADTSAIEPPLLARIRTTFVGLAGELTQQLVASVDGVFAVNINAETGHGEQRWILDLKTGTGAVVDCSAAAASAVAPADCTVTLSDETVRKWFGQEVDPMTALMEGMLTVEGDQMKMMSLMVLEPALHRCWAANAPATTGVGGTAAVTAAPVADDGDDGGEAKDVVPFGTATLLRKRIRATFYGLQSHINDSLVESVNFVFCFKIEDTAIGGQTWMVDFKRPRGSIMEVLDDADVEDADCAISLTTEVAQQWFEQELDLTDALADGRMAVSGSEAVASQLISLTPVLGALLQAAWADASNTIQMTHSAETGPQVNDGSSLASSNSSVLVQPHPEVPVVTGKTDAYGFPIPYAHLPPYLAYQADADGSNPDDMWNELLDGLDLGTLAGWEQLLDAKLYWRAGIPVVRRKAVWGEVTELFRQRHGPSDDLESWLARSADLSDRDREQIEADIPRTFVDHDRFKVKPDGSYHPNSHLPALRRILYAAIARNSEAGYWQGMAFIAGFLLLVFDGDEEQAFWALVLALDSMFVSFFKNMGIRTATMILEAVLLDQLPKLYGHFMGVGFPISTFATRWLICGFTTTLPCETCMRIWDMLFLTAAGHFIAKPVAEIDDICAEISDSCVDVLQLLSIALLRVHDGKLADTSEASELKDVLLGVTEAQYDHEIVMQAAYHEVLAVASKLEVDSEANLMTIWTDDFAWTQYLREKKLSSEEMLLSWSDNGTPTGTPKEKRKWTFFKKSKRSKECSRSPGSASPSPGVPSPTGSFVEVDAASPDGPLAEVALPVTADLAAGTDADATPRFAVPFLEHCMSVWIDEDGSAVPCASCSDVTSVRCGVCGVPLCGFGRGVPREGGGHHAKTCFVDYHTATVSVTVGTNEPVEPFA